MTDQSLCGCTLQVYFFLPASDADFFSIFFLQIFAATIWVRCATSATITTRPFTPTSGPACSTAPSTCKGHCTDIYLSKVAALLGPLSALRELCGRTAFHGGGLSAALWCVRIVLVLEYLRVVVEYLELGQRSAWAVSRRSACTRPSVWGLKLLVFEAFSAWVEYVYVYACMRGKVL